MKWLALGAQVLAHPSLLPIALATFVSVAGPGGIAEFGSNVSTGPIVAVAPNSQSTLVSEQPDALLVRVVHEQTTPVGPVVEAETPLAGTEEVIAAGGAVTGSDEAPAVTEGDPQIAPASEPDQQSPEIGDPPADPNEPEQPQDNPNNTGGGAGDAGHDGDQPADDDGGSVSPPQDDGNAGVEPPAGDSDGNGTGDTDEGACDIPGNGHENHDVEPGHDKSDDGVDDRCQQDEGGDEGTVDVACDVPGNGHEKHDVEPGHDRNNDGVDDRCQQDEDDEGTVDDECDVPGNGHDKHPVEPGHNKDGDGVDDRCQTAEGDNSGPVDGACDPAPVNGHGNDPQGHSCDGNDGGQSNGKAGGNDGSNGRKDDG